MEYVLKETDYTYDAAAKTITLASPYDAIVAGNIIRIVDLTTTNLLYDSASRIYPITVAHPSTRTVITHQHPTPGASADKLQIVISDASFETSMSAALDEGIATGGGNTTLTDTAKKWEVNCWQGYLVRIKAGTGIGGVRTVVSNTANILTVATWDTNPAALSEYELFAGGNTIKRPIRGAQTAHRTSVASADKAVVPVLAIFAQSETVGVFAATTHFVAAAAGNIYGTTGMSNIISTAIELNHSYDLSIPQSTGATYYDIFLSIDAAPKWVARVTETQRAAGCAVTAYGVVGAGGSAGVVNIQCVGTGIATSNAIFAQSTAYVPANATGISAAGREKIYADISLAVSDLRSVPALTVVPFTSYDNTTWYQGTPMTLSPLTSVSKALYQTFEMDLDGALYVIFLIGEIVGTGAAATIKYQLA
jgi:hypothetical protein